MGVCSAMAVAVALTACAGRDPQPIVTVQPQDAYSDCTMIRAEIEANNQKAKQLADEQGMKVAQNVAAGVVGLVFWPVWFGMDFKGAAAQDVAAYRHVSNTLRNWLRRGARRDIGRRCRPKHIRPMRRPRHPSALRRFNNRSRA
jgi:hypothetical protein